MSGMIVTVSEQQNGVCDRRSIVGLLLCFGMAGILAPTSGCGRRRKDLRKEKSKMRLRWLITAILAFKEAEGVFPDALSDLEIWFAEGKGNAKLQAAFTELRAMGVRSFNGVLSNPRTGTNPGYAYVKPRSEVAADPVVLQLQGTRTLSDKSAAYLDGTVR